VASRTSAFIARRGSRPSVEKATKQGGQYDASRDTIFESSAPVLHRRAGRNTRMPSVQVGTPPIPKVASGLRSLGDSTNMDSVATPSPLLQALPFRRLSPQLSEALCAFTGDVLDVASSRSAPDRPDGITQDLPLTTANSYQPPAFTFPSARAGPRCRGSSGKPAPHCFALDRGEQHVYKRLPFRNPAWPAKTLRWCPGRCISPTTLRRTRRRPSRPRRARKTRRAAWPFVGVESSGFDLRHESRATDAPRSSST
jgi:hypothetical protein